MIKDGDCQPLLYIKFCQNLLAIENNIYIANRILSNTISVINNYLPPVSFRTQKNEMFKLLTEKYYKYPQFESLKRNLVNYILDVINTNSLDNLKFFIKDGLEISIEEVQDDSEIFEAKEYDLKFLDLKTKKRIISVIYQNDQMTSIEKDNLKRIILDENNSNSYSEKLDEVMFNLLSIDSSDKESREGLWKLIVYNEKNLSYKELAYYMKGFNKQAKLFAPEIQKYYRKRFFSDFPYVLSEHSLNSAMRFYKLFNPTFLTRNKILKRMIKMKLKLRFSQENEKLRLLIESDIDDLKNRLLLEKINSHIKLHRHDNRFEVYY